MAAPAVLERSRLLVQPAIAAAVDRLCVELRRPSRYHFGWTEVDGSPSNAGSGKGLRPALAILSAEAVGAAGATAVPGAVATELVHNFSLVHDDIIDGDTERRHRATVWSAFGTDEAIISGDALHNLAYQVLLDDPSPHRLGFDLKRLLRTRYRIDDFQQNYFVIDSFEDLLDVTLNTDFGPVYEQLAGLPDIEVDTILPEDRIYTRGTQAYARGKAAL